ncbi:hypothetical protein IKP13_03070, partial [bacterium]|nr:hypothetical protein [bacterium]
NSQNLSGVCVFCVSLFITFNILLQKRTVFNRNQSARSRRLSADWARTVGCFSRPTDGNHGNQATFFLLTLAFSKL